MSLAAFESRFKDIEQQIAQSLANHNFLLGMRSELLAAINVLAGGTPAGAVLEGVEAAAPAIEAIVEDVAKL